MSRIELGPRDIRRASWFGLKPAVARSLSTRAINPFVRFAAARLLPASIGHRLPLNRRSVTYRLESGSSFELLDPLHDIVARDVYWGGGKPSEPAERNKLAFLERVSKSADLFIDVGAYAGICSLIATCSNPHLKVIAYELVPENFLLLVKNVIENDLVGRIDARLGGLGKVHSAIKVPRSLGAASYMTSISLGSAFERGVSIPVTPLDDDVNLSGRVVIKIDVEGFEDQVLKGASRLVRECLPDIICEVLPFAEESTRAISAMLGPLGYRWFCFEDHDLKAREHFEPLSRMRDWLLTCRPEIADL